jgi:hypothetical protein
MVRGWTFPCERIRHQGSSTRSEVNSSRRHVSSVRPTVPTLASRLGACLLIPRYGHLQILVAGAPPAPTLGQPRERAHRVGPFTAAGPVRRPGKTTRTSTAGTTHPSCPARHAASEPSCGNPHSLRLVMPHPHASAKPQALRNLQGYERDSNGSRRLEGPWPQDPKRYGQGRSVGRRLRRRADRSTVAGASARNHLRPHLRSVRPCPDEPWTGPRASLPVAATAAAPKTNPDPGSYGLQTGHRRSTNSRHSQSWPRHAPPPQGPAQRWGTARNRGTADFTAAG